MIFTDRPVIFTDTLPLPSPFTIHHLPFPISHGDSALTLPLSCRYKFAMYEITIAKSFSAAHRLKEIGGRCEDLHGHNFKVEVTVTGRELNEQDLLIDFRDLKTWTLEILEDLDHKYLNDLETFKGVNPSSERLARTIYDRLQFRCRTSAVTVSKVTVWESENARVSYRGTPA